MQTLMKILLILFALTLALIACSGSGSGRKKIEKSAILGIWWSPQMFQSAAFQIKDSTIYYPDDFKEYKYELRSDTLIVYQEEGYILRSVISRVTPDTLVLVTQGSEDIYTHTETPIP